MKKDAGITSDWLGRIPLVDLGGSPLVDFGRSLLADLGSTAPKRAMEASAPGAVATSSVESRDDGGKEMGGFAAAFA